MRVRILGTGTTVPSLERGSSSCLVTIGRTNVLIDIGPSVVRRLLEEGFTVNDIDVVILTHFHVDHTADLATFLFTANYGIPPRARPLFIAGGRGIERFLKRLAAAFPWIQPKGYELTIQALTRGSSTIDGLRLDAAPMNHNRESIAVRLREGDRSITLSGDTDYSRNLERLAASTELLIVECSFPDRKVVGHLNLETLQRIVTKAKPKKVLITHLFPEWEEFRSPLPSPYLMAVDGLELEV